MALADLLGILWEQWDEVQQYLDEPTRARIQELLDAPGADPERTARRIARLVNTAVPEGHPIRAALDDSVRYSRGSAAARISPDDLARRMRALVVPAAVQASDPPVTPPADADDWLLDADHVTAADYRADGHDPADPDLIRLTDRQGTVRLPSFQFDGASGRPLPLVVAVNRLLDADDDPWGVADWWLGANAWLNAVPARLLGTPGERSLLAAARAEIAEW
ncbi:hypothetical protein [Kitasatospora sp. NPDC093806]|uniref:hypothetical protein n=1 Tax=Kitasatospora sp. NPDC093806 TaxID=3155075 RepID=UPI00341D62CA